MTGSSLVLHAQDLRELQALSQVLVASRFFKDAQTEAQAAAKILAGRELGLGPMEAMRSFHVVEGKVEMSADLLAQRVKEHPDYDYRVRKITNEECEIEFLQHGESLGVSRFDQTDRANAGISLKTSKGLASTWAKYPRNMLFARALSNGVAWYCPDVAGGGRLYVEGEISGETEEPAIAEPVVIDSKTGEVIQHGEIVFEGPQDSRPKSVPSGNPYDDGDDDEWVAGSLPDAPKASEAGGQGDRGVPIARPPASATASEAGSTGTAARETGEGSTAATEGSASEDTSGGDSPDGESPAGSQPAQKPAAVPPDEASEPSTAPVVPEHSVAEPAGRVAPGSAARATASQKKRLAVLAADLGLDDDQRHHAAGVASFNDLTKDRADQLIRIWKDEATRNHEHVWIPAPRKGFMLCSVEGCGLARSEKELREAQGTLA